MHPIVCVCVHAIVCVCVCVHMCVGGGMFDDKFVQINTARFDVSCFPLEYETYEPRAHLRKKGALYDPTIITIRNL